MKIVIATIKSWNLKNAVEFQKRYLGKAEVHIIHQPTELQYEELMAIKPDYIFFPHWSWLIPQEIYQEFRCIIFHMTDLPFGRGGSPLQNLIEREYNQTKISALKVKEGLDTGDIYLKKDLNLSGTADEIFMRASKVIFFEMIPEIIEKNPLPVKQLGEATTFKRRTPEDGELKSDFSLEKIYDYIRMLDGEGYPRAFIQFGPYRLEFSRASFKNGRILADIEIIEGDK